MGVDGLGHATVDPGVGLTSTEARLRLAEHGPNTIPARAREPAWMRLARSFADPMVVLLTIAAVVARISTGETVTSIVVVIVVGTNTILGFVQQERAAAALAALAGLLAPRATVLRDGVLSCIDASDVVPGDVIAVEAGDRIAADAILVDAWNLETDESALTGESMPVPKCAAGRPDDPGTGPDSDTVPGRATVISKGTSVTRGRGRAVVTATGPDTAVGAIATSLARITVSRSPLQRQLDGLGRHLAGLAAVVVAVVGAVGLLQGRDGSDITLTAIALAVASLPEGLPAVVAVTLAVGARRLAAHDAIVASLGDVETLGATSVICTDKTGTVTANRMVASVVASHGRLIRLRDDCFDRDSLPEEVILAAALCTDTDGDDPLAGDPTDRALLAMATRAGADRAALSRVHPRIAEVPFESENKFMATVHDWDATTPRPGRTESAIRILVKGAPEAVLPRSTEVGGPRSPTWGASPIDQVGELAAAMAATGLRVIALAHRDVPGTSARDALPDRADSLVERLTLDALVGISDPPRPEVAPAVAEARRAGIEVKLITGDHPRTAVAVASSIGLAAAATDTPVLTGTDIDALDDERLCEAVAGASVFARVDPVHKLRIVDVLRRRGHVVAMTGDGVNDAPALRRADIGVAMGRAGTDVARESARMLLTDDNFATIVRAVRHGRIIHDNVTKFVQFQVTTTVGFAMLFLAAAVTGTADGAPMSPLAILLVNTVIDGPPALALGLDGGGDEVMVRPPRDPGAAILGRGRWRLLAATAAIMAFGTLGAAALAPEPEATTVAFNTFVAFQSVHLVVVHLRGRRIDRRALLDNPLLWAAAGTVTTLQILVTHHRGLGRTFGTVPLGAAQWCLCIAFASSLAAMEFLRRTMPHLVRRFGKGWRCSGTP